MSAGSALTLALEEVVDSYLKADALLAQDLVATLQHCTQLLPECVTQWSPEGVEGWWAKRQGLPRELEFLRTAVRAHHAPLLTSVSMCLSGQEPTLYVPVPWAATSAASLDDARACLWYNAPVEFADAQSIDWATSLRSIAHAIANLSYAVRLGDSPVRGWLAYAHQCGRLVYLPDTKLIEGTIKLDDGQMVHSVGTDEERYMGMASVIYLPLSSSQIPMTTVVDRLYASVVLMVWSPIPHLWDGTLDSTCQVQSLALHEKYAVPLGAVFRLLRHDVVRRAAELARSDADVLSIVTSLQARVKDGPAPLWPLWQTTMHGLERLLDFALDREDSSNALAEEWLADFFEHPNGACQTLASQFPNVRELDLSVADLRAAERPTPFTTHIRNWRALLRPMLQGAKLPLDVAAAQLLCAEPVRNIKLYCNSLDMLKIDISESYITIVVVTTLRKESMRQLVPQPGKSDSAADFVFRRYYGSRRGLPLWRSDGKHSEDVSLGMFLHGHASRRFGVFHRLYVSPDGSSSRVIIGMPLSANRPSRVAS